MMNETLLLRMPDGPRPASWLVVDAFGNRMGQPQSGELTQAAAFASGRRLRVCVPGSCVMLLHADIPSSNAQKVQQAVPFALEDKLAEDVDTLHFAVGARDARGYPVAVVTRTHMQQWLQDLSTAGLTPAEMLPDMLAVAAREHTLIVIPDDRQMLIRFPDGAGLAAETALIPRMIEHHLVTLPDSASCTHALVYASDEALSPEIRELLAKLNLETAYRPSNSGPIAHMATVAKDRHAINLLQGEFGLHGDTAEYWRRWRTPVVLAAVLCAVFFVQQVLSEFTLRHEVSVLNKQIGVLFHSALPNMKNVTDLGVMEQTMRQRFKQLAGGGENSEGLLAMLAAVGAALQSQTGVQLQSFNYHDGSLQLQVQAGSIDALDSVKSMLAQNPAFHVAMDSVSSSAGQTTGRLTLSAGGS
jgi:general secretion pathway protein L